MVPTDLRLSLCDAPLLDLSPAEAAGLAAVQSCLHGTEVKLPLPTGRTTREGYPTLSWRMGPQRLEASVTATSVWLELYLDTEAGEQHAGQCIIDLEPCAAEQALFALTPSPEVFGRFRQAQEVQRRFGAFVRRYAQLHAMAEQMRGLLQEIADETP